MKRIVFLFLLYISTIYPQTYYMNVWVKGNVTSIPVKDIQNLTFIISSSGVEDENPTTTIKAFRLFQNFPNPFNPSTVIKYQVSKPGNVEIKIFNVNGQLVKTFESMNQVAGSFSVSWDGKNNDGQAVASGLYICHVAFDSSVLTRKMLLIK
jgi:flagellar hook assembly protein FlgD